MARLGQENITAARETSDVLDLVIGSPAATAEVRLGTRFHDVYVRVGSEVGEAADSDTRRMTDFRIIEVGGLLSATVGPPRHGELRLLASARGRMIKISAVLTPGTSDA
jgi:hypothetical protein